jgi:drug/metabolite transporter (DMT)-like permease
LVSMPSAGVIAAFLAIYILWGSTYLAIRIAVATVPPVLAAGIRFFVAGLFLCAWTRARGVTAPTRREWRNLTILGALLFLVCYSLLFWAEKTVPSGVASVLVAAIPIWTVLLQVFVLRRERFSWQMAAAILLGFSGVAVLTRGPGSGSPSLLGCAAIFGSGICWSIGTVTSKAMALPESKLLSSGCQMLTGGTLLLLCSAALGEMHPFPHISFKAWVAIAYLIVAGSIVGFTAYVWLLDRMPATAVTSYAYVNPLVALLLGHWLGSETLGPRTALGAALILASVLIIGVGAKRPS